ncbi:MAG: hypothetical protein KC438_13300 [Thermomicrobiales bacterium]|nr:hypothetical protein [Thermomicrobiales bacterium]MCO5222023.1 hypothetical protein [Thermomicrobiales bacterium]
MTTKGHEGSWVTIDVGYVDPQRRSCALCGRPLARRIWRENVEGHMREFCEPAHVALYRDYWLPLYGAGAATASSEPRLPT